MEDLLLKFVKSVSILKKEERKYFYDLVIEGLIPPGCRAEFWKVCCGSKAYKSSYCRDYYKTLQRTASREQDEYPNPMFSKIDKDMNRTFQEDYFTDEVKASIKRVLKSYIWRNPTVGYIQGMNFLVFRLMKCLQDEEDTFWVFCCIVETYFTPDFYVDCFGA